LAQVIPGWREALKQMQVGSVWELALPPNLAYGERGAGRVIGPNQALRFEIELLEIR
jgi:FKBP-type peptidyl-prolyl cis-trans isomerase FklB